MTNSDDDAPSLVDLVPEKFKPLQGGERTLLEKVEAGEEANFAGVAFMRIDMEKAAEWGEERTLRAEVVAWLLASPKARPSITHRGVRVVGARVDGRLDVSYAEMPVLVRFRACVFDKPIEAIQAKTAELALDKSVVPGLLADRIKVRGNLYLRNGFKVMGEMRLIGAVVGGQLICEGATFHNPGGIALVADRIKVAGDVFLRDRFKAMGEVRLIGADIGGVLSCIGATFENAAGYALNANRIKVAGGVFLDQGFTAIGEVRFLGADIGGQFGCREATFENRMRLERGSGGMALDATGMKTAGGVFLQNGFTATGEVRLVQAQVGQNLECDGATFTNPGGDALNCGRIRVTGDVFFRREFMSIGQLRLDGAEIGGTLSCERSTFVNPPQDGRSDARHIRTVKTYALIADGFNVAGDVLFQEGCKITGEARLVGANIGDALSCVGSFFSNPGRIAFNGQSMTVRGSLFVDQSGGTPRLPSVIIGKLDLTHAKIERGFIWARRMGTPDGLEIWREGSTERLRRVGVWLMQRQAWIAIPRSWGLGPMRASDAERRKIRDVWAQGQAAARHLALVNVRLAEMRRRSECRSGGSSPYSDLADVELDLSHAEIGTIEISETVGRELGACRLQGLVYDAVGPAMLNTVRDDEASREWWKRFLDKPIPAPDGRKSEFAPQPYEQAAKVLREQGHSEAAKDILIAKEDRRAWPSGDPQSLPALWWRYIASLALVFWTVVGPFLAPCPQSEAMTTLFVVAPAILFAAVTLGLDSLRGALHWVSGRLMGYGHRPSKALRFAVAALLLAWGGGHFGYRGGVIVPVQARTPTAKEESKADGAAENLLPVVLPRKRLWATEVGSTTEPGALVDWDAALPRGYPRFQPLVFAVETFTPLVKLGQKDYWQAEPYHVAGVALRWLFWAVNLFGWIVSSMLLAAFTGILKK